MRPLKATFAFGDTQTANGHDGDADAQTGRHKRGTGLLGTAFYWR